MAYSEEILMGGVASHQATLSSATTQTILKCAVVAAIVAAVTAGEFTASVDVSSSSSVDTQYITALLNNAQYIAQVTGSDLVISW